MNCLLLKHMPLAGEVEPEICLPATPLRVPELGGAPASSTGRTRGRDATYGYAEYFVRNDTSVRQQMRMMREGGLSRQEQLRVMRETNRLSGL